MTKPVKDNDINILLPDGEVVIAGERLTVREYSLGDTMRLYNDMDGLINDIADKLVACASNKTVEFIDSLDHHNGYLLIYTWWQVNSPFFISAAVRKIARREAELKQRQQLIGAVSLQPLSNADTTPSA